MITAAGDRRW